MSERALTDIIFKFSELTLKFPKLNIKMPSAEESLEELIARYHMYYEMVSCNCHTAVEEWDGKDCSVHPERKSVNKRCSCDVLYDDKWWDDACPFHVACDSKCRALRKPTTLEEYKKALEHWRDHGLHSGCAHGC